MCLTRSLLMPPLMLGICISQPPSLVYPPPKDCQRARRMLPPLRMGDFEAEGRVCRNVDVLYCDMHDPKKAMPFIERGLAAARATGNLISEGKGLLSMGVAMQHQGHMEKARQCFQQAMDIAIKEENPKLEGIAAENLAQLLTLVGKFKSSINLHEKAIMLAESQGDNAGYAVAQGQLEVTLRQREQFLVALEYASRKR
eukprot:GDKJ01020216.1.p1 GENE.GDKJ01020216.1~~GDKJ01020216.1.p1  ORF type:complete len:199 (+),score=9.94 GDKJ01020216.1:410-1006(+)